MDKKQMMALGIASAAALVVALVASSFLSSSPPEPKVVVKDEVARTEVLVVASDVPMGGIISPGALKWTAWPEKLLSPAMITREAMPDALEKFANKRARAPLFRGEPLVMNKVIDPKEGGFLSALLPAGMRAVAVKISTETASGGFIQPNDRVDVMLTRRLGKHMVTDTVLYNVRVLAIDQKALPGESKEGDDAMAKDNVQTATLAVTEEQARVLAKVQSIGELTLALRSMSERSETALNDDKPRLSPKYARNAGGDVRTFRYGIPSAEPMVNN